MNITSNQIMTGGHARAGVVDSSAFEEATTHTKALEVLDNHTVPNTTKREAPIGLFDSGVGGLSVYLHLAEQLPAEDYIYYADTPALRSIICYSLYLIAHQ